MGINKSNSIKANKLNEMLVVHLTGKPKKHTSHS